MASYKQGILGAFSGKLGNVIGTFWKGISVMRVVPANITNPNTLAQQAQRAKFKLITQFVAANAKFFKLGFGAMTARMTEYNAAIKANFSSIIGSYPTLSVDPKNLVTSKGELPSLDGFAGVSTEPATIDITWDDNSGIQGAAATDKISMAAFDEATGEAVYALQSADRISESATFNLPASWTGKTVTVYAYLTREDIMFGIHSMDQISDSVKINGITVA